MLIVLEAMLTGPQLAELGELLARVPFADGRATAGWSAQLVKHNAQASPDPAVDMWRERIAAALTASPLFQLAARPRRIIGPLLSRHRVGDHYGPHVDEPIMDGTRTDLAFTLFLSDPAAYDGGELVIESPAASDAHKHAAGSLVLYPATTLHRVATVTRGERLAAVGWVRSLIRDAAQRELLFDLETARRRLFDRHGKTEDDDLLAKCCANLVRLWAQD